MIRLLLYPSKPTSRRRPPKYSAVPQSTASTEAVPPVGYCGYSQPTPCATARRINGAVRSRRTGAAVRGYSRGYSAVPTHRDGREGRADDAHVAGADVDTHEPAIIGLHTPRRAKLAAAPARRVSRRYSTALRVLRTEAVTPAGYCGYSQPTPCGTARRISGAEPPDGSRRTGAALRAYSRGYSAVRSHRDVGEGQADDADVPFAVAVDIHEPAAIGLHTPRRAKLAAAPAQGSAGGTPLRCEYCAPRR